MGNQPTYRSTPSRTHYTVHCAVHTWHNVYDGYDEGSYNYYRNSSGNCSICAAETNQRNRQIAKDKAEKARIAEENRIRKLKEENEKKEKERQENARKERERKRKEEQEKLLEKRRIEEENRQKIQKDLINKSIKDIESELNRLKNVKTTNPYIAWKKCDTLKTIKEISDKALECGYAGQVICEQVHKIKNELKDSLKKDFELVKPEIKRYEKYGNELKSMTTSFIGIFENILKESADHKVEMNEFIDDMQQNPDDKDYFKEEIENNIKSLTVGINKMESKLFLMEQYYDQMKTDYEYFIDFIQDKSAEYDDQKNDISNYCDVMSNDLKKQKKIDVFKGTKDVQKDFIEQKYDILNIARVTKPVQIGTKTTTGNYMAQGALIGAGSGLVVGVIAGACVGGVPGAIVGGIGGAVAGCLLGAAIGSLIEKKTITPVWGQEIKDVITSVKNGGSVHVKVNKQHYDGSKQAKAFDDIKKSMKKPINNFMKELKKAGETTNDQLQKCENLKSDIIKINGTIGELKTNIKSLKAILNSPKGITDSQKKMLKKKIDELFGKIGGMVQSMKQN